MPKRLVAFALLGFGSVALFGCPIYPSDRDHRVCEGGNCYQCPDGYYSSDCTSWSCNASSDCPTGYTCNSNNLCQYTSGSPGTTPSGTTCAKPADCAPGTTCGADNQCHAADCSTSGCPSGFVCALQSGSNGTPACIAIGGDGGATSGCSSDSDCSATAGARCLTGQCVAPADQCADATQCAANEQCVQGACTPTCSATQACPTGYACDTAKGVCTGATTSCTSSSQCTGGDGGAGTVCVEQHCVDPCGAGGTCAAGLKCVDGGCTPDQQPVFTCNTDGVQDSCQQGSICLRHSCYIACDADAGPSACKAADNFNQCKTVTTSSGPHSVCGSTNNLGTDCDPTQGKACASPLICIDGYCK